MNAPDQLRAARASSRARRAGVTLLATGLLAAPLAGMAGLPAATSAERAAAPRVTWTDLSVVAGKPAKAFVAPRSVPAGAKVVLQRKFLDQWRTQDATSTATSRGLRLDFPTDQYGRFGYRVAAVSGGQLVSASETKVLAVRPSYAPGGKPRQHGFLVQPRWHWDTCQGAITWVFNPNRAPAGALKDIKGALRRVHNATGLDFRYAGTTGGTPSTSGSGAGKHDLIFGWLGGEAFRNAGGSAQAVGVGGASYQQGFQLANGTRVSRAVGGGVVLNRAFNDDLGRGFGRGYTWGEVIMHEVGHVLSLDHVGARSQLMYSQVQRSAAKWGAGDLAGLAKIGDRVGCLSAVRGKVGATKQVGTQHEHAS